MKSLNQEGLEIFCSAFHFREFVVTNHGMVYALNPWYSSSSLTTSSVHKGTCGFHHSCTNRPVPSEQLIFSTPNRVHEIYQVYYTLCSTSRINFSVLCPGKRATEEGMEEGMGTQWHVSHDGAVIWVVLLERLLHVVVAHPAVTAETSLLRSAAIYSVRNPGLTRRVAYAAFRSVFASVGTSGETP